MQGIEALNQFKNFVSSIGGLGRYEDTYIVHAAEGETVVPMEVFNKNPVLKERLFESMRDMGIEPERYVVGNELNSINPITGQPEFFLKNVGKFINRVMPGDSEKYLPLAAGFIPGLSSLQAAGIGAGIGAASAAGRDEDLLRGALTGGLMGGAARLGTSKFASGTFGALPETDTGLKILSALNPFKSTQVKQQKLLDEAFGKGTYNINDLQSKPDIFKGLLKDANEILGTTGTGVTTKGVGSLGTLGTLGLGLGASALIGGAIGDPQDALVDSSKIYQAPKTDEFAFDPNMQFRRPKITSPIVQQEYDPGVKFAAEGGVMDLQDGGESKGPGTGTSDSIPAMLSDGEFVMTAKAVRGAGGGSRREGAKRMYEMMDKLEERA